MPKVFVYGTLLGDDSGRNYWGRPVKVLSSQHATILGSLFLKDYPFIVLDGKGMVRGKVFDVDEPTLKEYDEIEGIGESWYSRVKVEATLYDGTKVEAWVYCHKTSRGGEPVPSGQFGDWYDTNMFLIPKDMGVEVRARRRRDD